MSDLMPTVLLLFFLFAVNLAYEVGRARPHRPDGESANLAVLGFGLAGGSFLGLFAVRVAGVESDSLFGIILFLAAALIGMFGAMWACDRLQLFPPRSSDAAHPPLHPTRSGR